MKKGCLIPIIIGVVLLLIGIGIMRWGVGEYNSMVTQQEDVSGKWAQVENQYQRRADLIPNLVNTVKGYAQQEKETLEGVISARARATQITVDPQKLTPESIAQFEQAQQGLSAALGRLLMVREAYPDLKSNQNFLALQSQLEGTENRISIERKRFNESVQAYNAHIKKVPQNIVAGFGGFTEKGYFKAITPGAEEAPTVEF